MPAEKTTGGYNKGISVDVCHGLWPVNLAAGVHVGLKNFCKLLNPNYHVPCWTTITSHLGLLHDELKLQVTECVKGEIVSLTTDMWTSIKSESYIMVLRTGLWNHVCWWQDISVNPILAFIWQKHSTNYCNRGISDFSGRRTGNWQRGQHASCRKGSRPP
jgi:hypothetical protein